MDLRQSVRHIGTSLPCPAVPVWSLGRQAGGFPSPRDRRLGQILLFTMLFASARGLANTAIQATVDLCASPTVVYVDKDATGKGTGLSWKDAFTVIQQAINTAASRKTGANAVEVWVAEGTYDEYRYLTGGQGQNLGSVQMKPGVALYGGFDGTEFRREQRDWFAHETIIDGSRSQTGKPAYHVVLGANDATIDGFTITGGNASVLFTDEGCGGGMLNKSCSPLVANCTFLRNKAYTEGGGGIGNIQAAPRIVNCRFYGNNGGFSGGAISNNQSSPEIVNCLFVGNQADEGGAMICRDPAAPRIINCTFVANHAGVAGALCYVRHMELVNSILWANRATNSRGDQVYAEATATTATFSYCSIEGGINGPGFQGKPVTDGGHNLADDPLFARMPDPGVDGTWGTKDDDYGDLWLPPASPLIDKGDNAAVPADVTEDVARHLRIRDAGVDLGAYESGIPLDLWAVDLLRGWHELADGAAVEPGEGICIRAHTLTPNPFLHVKAFFSNGDLPRVLELDDGGFAYEGPWNPANAGQAPTGRIDIVVCAAECDDCPLGRCVSRWVTMAAPTDKADLVGNGLSLPVAPGDWGGAMQVDFAVLNQGPVAAPATQAAFYLSRDRITEPGSDVVLGQIDIPALEVGGLHTGKTVLCLPVVPPGGFDVYGTYCIGMVVDPASQVAENFKHNNKNRGIGIDLALFTLGPDDTSGPAVVGCAPQATSVRLSGHYLQRANSVEHLQPC